MKSFHKLIVAFLLFVSVRHANAQESVVVHGDPRLSLLLKKNHSAPAPASKALASNVKISHKQPASSGADNGALFHPAQGMAVPQSGDNAIHSDPSKSAFAASGAFASRSTSQIQAQNVVKPAAIHPAQGMIAPQPGALAIRTSEAVKPATAFPMRPPEPAEWAPKHHLRTLYSGRGYRVQIYSGPDRARAMDIKNEFSRNNPGVRTYLSYISPYFRVKVGNYRNRSDAVGMWREANSTYNPSMIVPDVIMITAVE